MKLSIMQPYFLPYLGYFQLIHAADRFIVYDDVAFIKQGWINRNRFLIGGRDEFVTVPVKQISSFKKINETEIDYSKPWIKKFLKTIQINYSKAPYFNEIYPFMEELVANQEKMIGDWNSQSLQKIAKRLSITTELIPTSAGYENSNLEGEERILDICRKEKATTYINMIGGAALYSKERFARSGIELLFLKPEEIRYPQGKIEFKPWLSIVDVMMHNPVEVIREYLDQYKLS